MHGKERVQVVGVGRLLVPEAIVGEQRGRRRVGRHRVDAAGGTLSGPFAGQARGRDQGDDALRQGLPQRGKGHVLEMSPAIRVAEALRRIELPALVDVANERPEGWIDTPARFHGVLQTRFLHAASAGLTGSASAVRPISSRKAGQSCEALDSASVMAQRAGRCPAEFSTSQSAGALPAALRLGSRPRR